MTKLDILSEFELIPVGFAYSVDGVRLHSFPTDINVLERVVVEYIYMDGWKGVDISSVRTFEELPANAQAYVRKLEELVFVPVLSVGVGPNREQTITVPKLKPLVWF